MRCHERFNMIFSCSLVILSLDLRGFGIRVISHSWLTNQFPEAPDLSSVSHDAAALTLLNLRGRHEVHNPTQFEIAALRCLIVAFQKSYERPPTITNLGSQDWMLNIILLSEVRFVQ